MTMEASLFTVHHPVLNFAVFSVSVPVCFKPRDHKIYAAVVLSVVCFTFKLLLKDKMSYPVRQCLFSSPPPSVKITLTVFSSFDCVCVCARVRYTNNYAVSAKFKGGGRNGLFSL